MVSCRKNFKAGHKVKFIMIYSHLTKCTRTCMLYVQDLVFLLFQKEISCICSMMDYCTMGRLYTTLLESNFTRFAALDFFLI